MAATANPFSVSVSSKLTGGSSFPKPNDSADFFLRVQNPLNSVSLGSSFVSPGLIELSLSRGGGSVTSEKQRARSARLRASFAEVMDQSVAKADPIAPTTVDVNLGDRSYPIYIGSGLLDLPHLLQRYFQLIKEKSKYTP